MNLVARGSKPDVFVKSCASLCARLLHSPTMARIAIGSDHAGYELKQHLIGFMEAAGHSIDDQGTHSTESVDYPEICAGVGRTVRDGKR